jgi:pyruvate formate lyase activating enzyme
MAIGVVTDIQRFSLHDGPGIRTTVFMKGCLLRCAWCHNPEGLASAPEWMSYPGRSPELVGRQITAEEVVAEVLEDRAFYEPEGGVTLSGGEPLQQGEFALNILQGCKRERIHTAIETSLCYDWSRLEAVLDWVDLIVFDFKLADEEAHRRYTGASNSALRSNLARLNATGKPLIARTPLIAGVNDTAEEMERITAELSQLRGLLYYELLPYHPLGNGKYAALGRAVPAFSAPLPATLHRLADIGRTRNLTVLIGGIGAPAHEQLRR